MDKLISAVTAWVVGVIAALGYGGIVILMAIESACVPLPSEITMPFAGYLVSTGRFALQTTAVAGAIGCLLGSYVAYFVGASGGRWFLERYGRYVLIAPHEIELADWFFERWGSATVFWARLLPVVRTFIAFPAGVARMRLLPFTIYTLIGSYLWCLGLTYAGRQLGRHWQALGPYFHRFDSVIGGLLVAGGIYFVYRRLRSVGILGGAIPARQD
ncbi:MAG TPA: DedA family protein [Candidatus Binataceae bacterium]|nr:DedA family protein [Candidatus Binataceae bacterium]